MLNTLLAMATIAIVLGAMLGFAAIKLKRAGNLQVEKIDALLPQTQCGQCSYPGCKPYATAIAAGEADINRCPPGGVEGIQKIADLLGVAFKPFGADTAAPKPKSVAVIAEHDCIGCTLCIQACPVDAIVGASKQMHTIITAECTGCELCVAPCPVDCISMVVIEENIATRKWPHPVYALAVAPAPKFQANNSIIVSVEKLLPPPPPAMPCIRCTRCVDVCPADLQPQDLFWFAQAKQFDKAQAFSLDDCTECGACNDVCPSHIPLVDYYRYAKSEIRSRAHDQQLADQARVRYQFHEQRIERDKLEKADKLTTKAQASNPPIEPRAVQ